MDKELIELNQQKKTEENKNKGEKFSQIGFMAVYGSMAAPKIRGLLESQSSLVSEREEKNPDKNDSFNPPSEGRLALDCCKRYYKKRRYCCPGKRRYKADKRCCAKRYNKHRINLCNRNWARISIHPFINFLRIYRRRFSRSTAPSIIARKGQCEWKRMSCKSKYKFYEQAKRARIRGYRT